MEHKLELLARANVLSAWAQAPYSGPFFLGAGLKLPCPSPCFLGFFSFRNLSKYRNLCRISLYLENILKKLKGTQGV